MSDTTSRIETWEVRTPKGSTKRVGKIVHRRKDGTFHGATNHKQRSAVGQVSTHRR